MTAHGWQGSVWDKFKRLPGVALTSRTRKRNQSPNHPFAQEHRRRSSQAGCRWRNGHVGHVSPHLIRDEEGRREVPPASERGELR